MEALQMLKFHLKKARLNFTKSWMTPEVQMLQDRPEEDLLAKLFQGDFQDGLDEAIQSMNI
jgi:hypothetical protein